MKNVLQGQNHAVLDPYPQNHELLNLGMLLKSQRNINEHLQM